MYGWTDGWMEGSQKCHLILFIFKRVNKYAIDLLNIFCKWKKYDSRHGNMKNLKLQKMTTEAQGPSIKSFEHFTFFRNMYGRGL